MRKHHICGSILLYLVTIFSFYMLMNFQIRNDNVRTFSKPRVEDNTIVQMDKMKFIKSCRKRIAINQQTSNKLWVDHYKNPCFHKDGTLHCLPYFLVAGFPKCGTTDLYDRMKHHPEFIPSKMKELHWLSRYRFLPLFQSNASNINMYSPKKLFGMQLYTQMFSELSDILETSDFQSTAITADFSPSTFWDNDVYSYILERSDVSKYYVENFVHDLNPCMKFIIMMRNPVERLYSDYLFLSKNNTAMDFHKKVKDVIKLYKNCMKKLSPEQCFQDYKLARKSQIRLRIGAYSVYIKKWLKSFPRNQMLFVRIEDYATDTRKVLQEIFEFLEMDPVTEEVMDQMVIQKPSNSKESRGNTHDPMLKNTYNLLSQFYEPYNNDLSQLLGDSKWLWH